MIRRKPIYYGWIILAALCVTEPISWGVLYDSFAVFLKPMERDLRWTSSQLTGAFSLSLLIGGFAGIPIGRWLDRRGPRALMTAGSIGAVLLLLMWSRVHTLWAFYAIWAGIGLASAMVFYEPAFVFVANWFSHWRARALAALTFAAGCSVVIFVPASSWLVTAHGWRMALVMLAALLGAVTIPLHALVLRRRPQDLGLAVDGGPPSDAETRPVRVTDVGSVTFPAAIRHSGFWWLGSAYCLALVANVAIAVHIIPLLSERGFGASFTAFAAGGIALASLPGRLFIMPLGERIDVRFIAAVIFALQAAGLIVLLVAHARASVWLFVILFGLGIGAISATRASLVADIYGPKEYGAINGAMAFFTTIARALGPIGGSLVHDHLGGYRVMLIVLACCSAGAGLAIARVRLVASSANLSGDRALARTI